jgi:phage gp46-like protein
MAKYFIACFVGVLVAVLCPLVLMLFNRRLRDIQRGYWGDQADKYEADGLLRELRELHEE